MQLLMLQNLVRNGYIPHPVLTREHCTSSEGCVAGAMVITTFTNWNLNVILLNSNMAAFCSFTVPLNQTLGWFYLWWRAVKGKTEVIFSSRFPAVPVLPRVWGISPIQARVTHFPRPCTHMWHRDLDFQRDLNWLVLPAFGGVVLLGIPGGSSSRALLSTWSSQGSSQAQPGREQSLENLIGCHLSSWDFTQSPTGLCCFLFVQEIQLW